MMKTETIDALVAFVRKPTGYGYQYILAMDQDGQEVVVERTGEPCYGGLRKYKSTHGEDCTQKETYKPGDLNKPFPEGIPLAVGFPLTASAETLPIVNYLWSDKSPFRKGFSSEKDLLRVEDAKGTLQGFVLLETDVDPTVMVNLAKITRVYVGGLAAKFNTLVKEGATELEAWIACALGGGTMSISAINTNTYMFPALASIRRIKEADPRDVTGGTFKKRFDYNRKDIQDIFSAHNETGKPDEKEKPVIFPKVLKELAAEKKLAAPTAKQYVELTREIIKKYS